MGRSKKECCRKIISFFFILDFLWCEICRNPIALVSHVLNLEKNESLPVSKGLSVLRSKS